MVYVLVVEIPVRETLSKERLFLAWMENVDLSSAWPLRCCVV